MALTSYHHFMLAQMGIPVWQFRERADQQQHVQERETELTASTDARLDLACWVLLPTKQLDDTEKRLLSAMLKAIGLTMESVALFGQDETALMTEIATASHKVLVLGDTMVKQEKLTDVAHVVLPALHDLLRQPSQKQLAWHALQRYAQLN